METPALDTPERPGGSPAEEELAAQFGEAVRRLARRLRRSSSQRLELYGLTDGQARVLRLVERAGSPLRMSEIARQIEVVPRSATTVVADLETKGLVLREIDPDDRRSILVRLTEPGVRLLTEMGRDRDTAARELLVRLPRADRVQLLQLITGLVAGDDREGLR